MLNLLMPSIQNFFKGFYKAKYNIYLTIFLCILVDAFFFYWNGIHREYIANEAYIDFIHNFPQSILSVRQEPVFITLSYLLSKILGSDIAAIIILKNTVTALQLFVFYKIARFFTKDDLLPIFSVCFLNFSFAYISITDNLLRNHLANLFLLVALYFIFSIILKTKKIRLCIILASLSGGLLIYTHVLSTLILDFSLLFFITFHTITTLFRYYKLFPNYQVTEWNTLRILFIVGTIIFLIQSPYIIRFIQTQAGVSDYKASYTVTSPLSQIPKETTTNDDGIKKIPPILSKIFRIAFEYRLPGLSIFTILIVLITLASLSRTLATTSKESMLVIFWLVTYLGSKVDLLFGIGTLPYRFSLMLIFPTILLLIIFLDYLTKKIHSSVGKFIFSSLLLISFLGNNLPLIAEATFLKNYNDNPSKQRFLEQSLSQVFSKKETLIFLTNGLSFDNYNPSSSFLRNDLMFTTTNEKELASFMMEHHVNYVIFDHSRIDEKGNDLGSIVSTNLATYQHSHHFQSIGEFVGQGLQFSIFKFQPSNDIISNPTDKISLRCFTEDSCQKELALAILKTHSTVTDWKVRIIHSHKVTIHEYVFLSDNKIIEIRYGGTAPADNRFKKEVRIHLFHFPERPNRALEVTVSVNDSLLLLDCNGISLSYRSLEKYGVNKFIFSGYSQGNEIHYITLTRNGYRFVANLIALVVMLLLFFSASIFQKKKRGTIKIFSGESKKTELVVWCIILFSILDMIFINMFFLEAYKRIIGA